MDASKTIREAEEHSGRKPWERPVLRRLAANEAGGSKGGCYDDDNTLMSSGDCGHHLS